VRSLGQVELLFTLFVARLWLGESPTRREQLGTFFVGVSVIGVLIYH
jgi:drug/metabolite transporter (DMT)-like permease